MYFVTFIAKNLLRRKMRSVLTCVGVSVAVGAMVALLGVASGFARSTLESFLKRGVDLLVQKGGVTNQLNSELDEKLADRIKQIPGVRDAAGGLLDFIAVRKGTTDISVLVQGWQPGSFLFDDVEILSGRTLEPADRTAVLLGFSLADTLGKKVSDTLDVQGEKFQVVGIYQVGNNFEDGAMIVPLHEFQNLMEQQGRVTGFSVRLDHTPGHEADSARVIEQINALTNAKGRPLGLSAQTSQDYVKNASYVKMSNAMAWLTSAIAVVIGGIGMLNTMIMSVFERVREIGILRAVGWRKGRVVRMILGESVTLSLAGAVFGTAGAVVLTRLLTRFPQVHGLIRGDIAPAVVVEGFLMALLLGLLGGTYPAYRASRLLPTEALRHE